MNAAEKRIVQHRQAAVTLELYGPNGDALPPNTSVHIEQQRHRFLFGCNIFKLNRCKTEAHNAAYAERFSDLLNFATLPFYWWNYEREKGKPADARSEEVIRWCRSRDITTKGHPLAWNYIEPPWLDRNNPAAAMQRQMRRIARCVERFAGDIDIWDVVNEATHYDRATCKDRAPTLTQAIADLGVGRYLRQAFVTARQANPNATLLINDYRTGTDYADKVLAELAGDGDRALYDIIGIQSHMHGGPWKPARTWDICERFAAYGVPLHFTETTVVSGPKRDEGWVTTAAGEAQQADAVAAFYTLLFSHPAVEAITWWDFTDQNAWQRAPAGLLRDDMTPKPAYHRLRQLIKEQWWTRETCTVQSPGRVDVRGFLGDYRVSAEVDGRRLAAPFTLERHGMQRVTLERA
jgi:GH35 family endo-1,4-beta-xylanase